MGSEIIPLGDTGEYQVWVHHSLMAYLINRIGYELLTDSELVDEELSKWQSDTGAHWICMSIMAADHNIVIYIDVDGAGIQSRLVAIEKAALRVQALLARFDDRKVFDEVSIQLKLDWHGGDASIQLAEEARAALSATLEYIKIQLSKPMPSPAMPSPAKPVRPARPRRAQP